MLKKPPSRPKYSPDDSFERQYDGFVCGVDEAGRGPLAGPVVATAVILNRSQIPDGLDDSKRISHKVRERLLNEILKNCHVGIGISEPEEIDRLNILGATMIAMQRAVNALPQKADVALIDGNKAPNLECRIQTIIKGDSRSLSIAAASIVAKVTRDRLMQEADLRYPAYNFAKHKGYPTPAHKLLLKQEGPSPIHRYSFAPIKLAKQSPDKN